MSFDQHSGDGHNLPCDPPSDLRPVVLFTSLPDVPSHRMSYLLRQLKEDLEPYFTVWYAEPDRFSAQLAQTSLVVLIADEDSSLGGTQALLSALCGITTLIVYQEAPTKIPAIAEYAEDSEGLSWWVQTYQTEEDLVDCITIFVEFPKHLQFLL